MNPLRAPQGSHRGAARLRRLRPVLAAAGAALAGAVLLGAPLARAERVAVDRVRVVVDDLILTERELESVLRLQARELKNQFEGEELESRLRTFEQNLIDRMVEDLLLENRARRLGIEVKEDDIDRRLDNIIARDSTVLDTYGEAEIKNFILKDLLKQRVLQREVNAFVHVEDAQVREACEAERRDARQVHVAHILIRGGGEESLERTVALRQRLDAGEDFFELAAAESEDPSVTQNKGDLGFIARGQFVKEFEEAAFAMKLGEVSTPVKTQFGYHLITVIDERMDEGIDCERMDDIARNRFSDTVFRRLRQERMTRYLARLREDAEIQVLDTP